MALFGHPSCPLSPWIFTLTLGTSFPLIVLLLSPPPDAPVGYPCINSNKRVGDNGKRGKAETSLPLFPLPIVPSAPFFPLPSLPATQSGLCREESSIKTNNDYDNDKRLLNFVPWKKIVWLLSACVKATSKIDHYRFSFCMYNGTDSVKQKRNSTTPINTLLFRLDIKFHSLWRRRTFSLLVMHSKRDNRGEELGRDIKHNLRTFRGAFLGRRHNLIIGSFAVRNSTVTKVICNHFTILSWSGFVPLLSSFRFCMPVSMGQYAMITGTSGMLTLYVICWVWEMRRPLWRAPGLVRAIHPCLFGWMTSIVKVMS